ncbi:MAG: TonB-dependent receptor [Bacteroidaceae bacterium]|nr:TonB-dependent receptor [Bacteroidaceae bacterium]
MKHSDKLIAKVMFWLLLLIGSATAANAQDVVVTGHVSDSKGDEVIGASVVLKGQPKVATITDFDGNFSLKVPASGSVLVVSYIGMNPKEVKVAGGKAINVVLTEDTQALEEVVVVGYGQQKKASVVGAITQTTGKVLERSGGVSSVAAALTGNLPGVITMASSGLPGEEDPQIIIRAANSWNGSDPLVLVDGIEREMSSVDISSVESISVLKDASATAVYGVKGANGVILITTKRGKEGKANVQVKANITAKVASKLPKKYDAYDTFYLMNNSIEREAALNAQGWGNYTPVAIIDKYRNPANTEEWDRYPNTDWEEALFNKMAMSYNASVNVAGGTNVVKYFAAADFTHEGDLFKSYDNGRGYNTGFGYNRINVRSNLDFSITKTTTFSVNLFGSNASQKTPWDYNGDGNSYWGSAYKSAPDAMRPIYSNGMWGWYAPRDADVPNSVRILATGGDKTTTTTRINSDISLVQDLSMVTKGLRFKGLFSLDYKFVEGNRGINDQYHDGQMYWVNPNDGEVHLKTAEPNTGLDVTVNPILWQSQAGSATINWSLPYRKIYYSFQFDYDRTFNKHQITALGLFSREQTTYGSDFPIYREDWVFRLTYNWAQRYFAEFNGAYNGSEKFGPNKRFEFFPSVSVGWMISDEPFLKYLREKRILDMLKVRGSWGRVGDDSSGGRHLYSTQYSYGGNVLMGSINPQNSPYTFYYINRLGNENISWETVEKFNFGVDYAFLDGIVAGSFDLFRDKRTDIIIAGDQRASVPSYFGASPPTANLGIVNSRGYELEVRLNKTFNNGIRAWLNASMTHAVNEVKFRDDPALKPDYQKNAGHALGQVTTYIDHGNLSSWDDVIGSTAWNTGNEAKLPGDYVILDFNGDGVVNTEDKAPYQYSTTPQNTYNASFGIEWKGLSIFAQFYGVKNVSRYVKYPTFRSTAHVAYDEGEYWTVGGSATNPTPRWGTTIDECADGTRYLYDGSYVRLKNVEIAYTMKGNWLKKAGINTFRIYLNGNNLFMWSKMPDDCERGSSGDGVYPTMRRFNLGFDITL